MTLHFTISQDDVLAFSEQYYRDSPSHQKARTRTRWLLPVMLVPAMILVLSSSRSVPLVVVLMMIMITWYVFSPRYFDARVRRYAKKQLGESSFTKMFGKYELTIGDDYLESKGPTGESKSYWNAVDRIRLTDEFLFVFLTGPTGYVIPIDQIGVNVAQTAYTRMTEMVANVT